MGCLHAMESCSIMSRHVRGKAFITRKVTRTLVNISLGTEKCLYVGNLDSKRDWGHAKDFVRMQWLMLQQTNPDDFIIATGKQYSVRELINTACKILSIEIKFSGSGNKKLELLLSHLKTTNL